MKKYIFKNQNGKHIYGRKYDEAIRDMLHNSKEAITVDGHRITVQSKKSTDDGCEVTLFVEGLER